ncbi:hypothetical protein E6H18_10775 [Candidatus Bathyarchaeota archaeon]|nr:MAG: hypothetical protein E6H18_10775 [Candidatus Bathyarchaeota archaeon]
MTSSRNNFTMIAFRILIAVGVTSLLMALVLLSQDSGSCRLLITGTGGSCDNTFPGTTIYILPVITALAILGPLALGFGIGILLLSRRHRHTTQPTPSQAG